MLKRKLNLFFALIILTALLISSIITSIITTNNYYDEIENELEKLLNVSSLYLNGTDNIDYNSYAMSLNETTNYRITIVASSGVVIGESDQNYLEMDNHIYREEIKESLVNEYGVSIRKSNTTKQEYMYVAKFIPSKDIIVRISISLNAIEDIHKKIYLYTALCGLVAFIFTMLLSLKLSKSLAKPIELLTEHTKIVKNGNYSHRIAHSNSNGELHKLIDSVNTMTEDLDNSFNSLNTSNIQLDILLNSISEGIVAINNKKRILFVNDIVKNSQDFNYARKNENIQTIKNTRIVEMLEHTIKNIESIKETINIADRIYSCYSNPISFKDGIGAIISIEDITTIKKLENIRYEFVSNVTHELNTPLTSIKGFVETLKNGAIDNKEIALSFLDIIDIETDRLGTLIEDTLTLSSLESLTDEKNKNTVNIKKVSNKVLTLLDSIIQKNGISILNEINSDIFIEVDEYRLKQLFINLIDNAIKYNKENGSIKIFTSYDNDYIKIHFKDSGIGIKEEDIDRLFERFYRVDKGRSRNMGGTGLGLSIVKHIVLMYGGDIEVKSSIGIGSEFIISFKKIT